MRGLPPFLPFAFDAAFLASEVLPFPRRPSAWAALFMGKLCALQSRPCGLLPDFFFHVIEKVFEASLVNCLEFSKGVIFVGDCCIDVVHIVLVFVV